MKDKELKCNKCGKNMEYYEEHGLYGYVCVSCLKKEHVLLEGATTPQLLAELRKRQTPHELFVWFMQEYQIWKASHFDFKKGWNITLKDVVYFDNKGKLI